MATTASVGDRSTTVAFPAMEATDVGTPEPTINCTGAFVGSPRVFLAKDATAQSGVFPVSASATTVSCTARDEAGNTSPAVTLRVMVTCPDGTNLTSGICQGARGSRTKGDKRGLLGCTGKQIFQDVPSSSGSERRRYSPTPD
jgi:hypothetical protein